MSQKVISQVVEDENQQSSEAEDNGLGYQMYNAKDFKDVWINIINGANEEKVLANKAVLSLTWKGLKKEFLEWHQKIMRKRLLKQNGNNDGK
jgi:hypothetical protein